MIRGGLGLDRGRWAGVDRIDRGPGTRGLGRETTQHRPAKFRGSIVVSIPACHAGDPGSIPGLGVERSLFCVFLVGGSAQWVGVDRGGDRER
jgi:hypothetical protein